jgi:hypothetical protein
MLRFVSLLPVTTKLMVTHMGGPDARTAVTIYGLNQLVASLLLTGLMVYVALDRELIEQSPGLSPFSGDVQSCSGGYDVLNADGKTVARLVYTQLATKEGATGS